MRPIKVLTDVYSDLYLELRNEFDIDYFKFQVEFDGKEDRFDLDWKFLPCEKFYFYLANKTKFHMTSAREEKLTDKLNRYLSRGYDVLYISAPSKLNPINERAKEVAKKVLASYPEGRIEIVDSKSLSLGEGLLAIEAKKLVDQNLSLDEILGKLSAMSSTVLALLPSYDALKEEKVVSGWKGIFGGKQPIVSFDENGAMVFKEEAKKEDALKAFASQIKADHKESSVVYLLHGNDKEKAEALSALLKKEGIEVKEIVILGPANGLRFNAGSLLAVIH